MPRGGPRANSGGWRPGSGGQPKALRQKTIDKVVTEAGISPLEYLLSLVADDQQPMEVRMRAAGMALPYCHGKKGDEPAQPKSAPVAAAEVAEVAMGGRYAPRQVRGFAVVNGDLG